MKTCNTCKESKSSEEFHKSGYAPDGLQYRCKSCDQIRQQERYARDREKILARQRAQREKHPEKWTRRNWRWKLKRRYGISEDEYDAMLVDQGGKCPICGADVTQPTEKNGPHPVDHCHETGTVRGILCMPCNTGLGNFRDDPERLRAAAAYLEQFRTS